MDFRRTVDTYIPHSTTLPGEFYTSAEIFASELERIFYDRWVCIGREEQIRNAGDYITVKVGNESLIVLRDPDGGVRGFYNVCRHRAALLCSEAKGHHSTCIRCPYHGWTYDLTGSLIAAPLMEEVPDFQKADFPLHAAAVHGWEGFLFLNLAREPAPFATVFAPIHGRFSAWRLGGLRVARSMEYEVPANWKIIMENYSECYHCPLIHAELNRKIPYRSGRNDLFEGPFLGGYMDLKPDVSSLTRSGRTCGPVLGDIAAANPRRVFFYAIFPNLTVSMHPDYVMYFTVWPLAIDRTRVVSEWLFAPEAIANGACEPDDAVQFWDTVNREDWRVCGLVQQGIRSRSYRPSPYSNTESLLAAFNREVLKSLGR